MSTTTERLLSTDEAAARLGIKRETLATWRVTGRYNLPFVKVGRRIKYRQSDLDKWLQSRSATHTGEPNAK